MATRYKTRVIAVVHSHVTTNSDTGVINLSDDLIEIHTSKQVKSAGQASLTLVPRKNYFDLIFPNDLINIYIDPGDGERGFIRTFFGYVDKVTRSSRVTDEKGTVSTNFVIHCTDFTKVFDRTDIYFNPHLKNRSDLLDPRFGLSQLAGLALQTRGIIAHGSPADMVENLATLLLGFGAQWSLPKSYAQAAREFTTVNRNRRRQRTKSKVPTNALNQAAELFGTDIEGLDFAIEGTEDDINTWLNHEAINRVKQGDSDETIESIYNTYKGKFSQLFSNSLALSAFQTVLRETSESSPYTFLDLIDLSFIEAMSIDGWLLTAAIWESQGSLASIMYNFSNEVVNELFFDLRPVVVDSTQGFNDSCFGEQYSKQADELGINVNGTSDTRGDFKATVPAVKYVPAIVMREYPYSVVEGLDLRNTLTNDGFNIGFCPFGPIFQESRFKTNSNYRVLYDYRKVTELTVNNNASLNPNKCAFADVSSPLKHLDVVSISTQDIIEDSVGRSDHAVYNFFSMYTSTAMQESQKYSFQNILPIVTPISVERNGLRVMEITTKFADHTRDDICGNEAIKTAGLGSGQVERNLIRWALLLDHWNQHNNEYLDGQITLKGMPEIRVGYRLDWLDRSESYYVEGVENKWQYGKELTTTVSVSRGQRNDPFPAYIPPTISKAELQKRNVPTSEFEKKQGGNRGKHGNDEPSRLSEYFKVKPHLSTIRNIGATNKDLSDFSKLNIIDQFPEADKGGIAIYPNRKAPREIMQAAAVEVAIAVTDPENPELAVQKTVVKSQQNIRRPAPAPVLPPTMLTEHFSLEDFKSHDGVAVPLHLIPNVTLLAQNLEIIRTNAGDRPIRIISGFRSASHNNAVGGATASKHLTAEAADITISGMSLQEVRKLIKKLMDDGAITPGGLVLYPGRFVHYDVRGFFKKWPAKGKKSDK